MPEVNISALYQQALALEKLLNFEKWRFFKPYPKQKEFLAAGERYSERLLMAGNRLGKTECAGYEVSRHLTGEYPEWWQGKRFEKPIKCWVAGTSAVGVRDAAQDKLLGTPGNPEALGTGFIPKAALIGNPASSRSAPNGVESFSVRHKSGGISTVTFKTYEQERQHWQGATLDLLWCDEEPPQDLYTEGLTRLATTRGLALMTFTPLIGMSPVVLRFMQEDNPTRIMIRMGINDAGHFTPEDRERVLASYPAHEREARANGTPLLGSGNVFQTPVDDIMEDEIPLAQVPMEWVKLWALDFGIDHPFAAVLIAWDRDTDTIHVLRGFKVRNALPLQHADRIKRIAGEIPVAWPHDGHQRERASGESLAAQYKQHGLRMYGTHATHSTGGFSTYAGVLSMDEYMRAGRFKVNRQMGDWFDEYRMYHYKDGQIVKAHDDLMSATRIGHMMRRIGKPMPLGPTTGGRSAAPKVGSAERLAAGTLDGIEY